MSVRSRLLAADWLVPVVSEPVRDGMVVLHGDRVAWLGPAAELPSRWSGEPIRRIRGVITPGLVNAHTHLQYTGFYQVGRGRYTSFEHWSDVFGEVYDTMTDPQVWHRAARRGVALAVRGGTTVFAEIITNKEARGALQDGHVTGIEYLEAIGQFDRLWHTGGRDEFLARLDRPTKMRCGVSPHAPYSLDGGVITDLMRIARDRGMRVHTHLGESAMEADLYKFGHHAVLSPYGDLRDEFELVRTGGSGHSTAGYADSIGLLTETTHVAHAIYLDRPDRDLLRARGTRIALCPRSNAVIGLAEPPVAAYLTEGHDIAVGTDSLASSPSLDLMEDVAALARIARKQGYPGDDLDRRLIHAATRGGARALGLDGEGYGTLAVDGPADLAAFALDFGARDSVESVLVAQGAGRCILTIAAGSVLYDVEGSDPDPMSLRHNAAGPSSLGG